MPCLYRRVLVLVLARFNDGQLRNTDAGVVPLKLSLAPYVDVNKDATDEASYVSYVLCSQLLHKGNTIDSGESVVGFFLASTAFHLQYVD